MNKQVRLLTGILFALLLLAPSSAFAMALSISSADGSPSETITLDVTTDGITDIVAAQVYITIDTNVVSFDSFDSDVILSPTTNFKNGKFSIIVDQFSNPITLAADEVLFSITVQTKPNASGSTNISFISTAVKPIVFVDESVNEYFPDLNGGTITFLPLDVDDDAVLPKSFAVSQNYPNPFNPSTVINVTINERSDRYFFRVYNTAGQLVEERDLGVLGVGDHPLKFTGEHLPSGVYMYQITSGEQSVSKLMMLVK
ncbi:MAG: T9SS type A sorting domain-containing protein [Candidatus Zixiibacteriota bacterium]